MKNIKTIQNKLISWGENNIDQFPWRKASSLYEIVVAEIMLIRTSADQVLPVYTDFIKAFPNEKKLSEIKVDIIKNKIKSLGLLWRANQLKEMAIYLNNNEINRDTVNKKLLMNIPGIGEYSSSAILIFYFEKRSVPVDSNTVRFIKRFYNKKFNGEARRDSSLHGLLNKLIPKNINRSVSFNIAFLDFMRKICLPKKPKCFECILKNYCLYFQSNS